MVFWELSVLLPRMNFELLFIGEGLPTESDEEQLLRWLALPVWLLVSSSSSPDQKLYKRSIRIKAYSRAYHMVQGPKPDLVIGIPMPSFSI
ncbi:hypothetical protein UPYG_G00242650 [Umbra pygmaea]|uniref:Uncharacterized protein n=1 Tax=Umbra pygmaea TaxID=75934 RepID=A0ABD0WXW7_UMBPY